MSGHSLLPRYAVVAALALLCLLSCGLSARAADPASLSWDSAKQGGFVTCLCRDLSGNTWVGTEDFGVWRFTPSAPDGQQWTQFHGSQDYGQTSCYALCCDKLGRVWGGGLHGLAVFNGSKWRRFTPLNGPPGRRLFALTTSPIDGDVWGATEAGLFRYSLSRDAWSDYSRLDGLPSDAIQSLCFDSHGRLYVGTQADGLCYSSAAFDFRQWIPVPGPAQMPSTPVGDGLPSPLVNCLCAARDGTVYCGTTCGMALSTDSGLSWRFMRGADWKDKVQGLYHGPAPNDTYPGRDLLNRDYVTSVAEDAVGRIWIGYWQQVPSVWDARLAHKLPVDTGTVDYVTSLLPAPDGSVLIGGYGSGLAFYHPAPDAAAAAAPTPVMAQAPVVPPQPAPSPPAFAAPPTLSELNALLAQAGQVGAEADRDKPFVVSLDDDWQTEGDWLGRYGRYWACLCALFHPIPLDYLWGAGWEPVDYDIAMGPDHDPGDRLRYWMQWRYTDNPNSLELPPTYLHSRVLKGYTTWQNDRRQSEVDDHGESMVMSRSGPGVFCTVTIPEGLYYLSLYEFNKDGHDGDNARRDYCLSVRSQQGVGLDDLNSFAAQPELARGRVREFWGGVWKRFLVRGPQALTVQIDRNNSKNTILPGIMLDLVDEDPAPYFHTVAQWQVRETARDQERQALLSETAAVHGKRFQPCGTDREAAGRLFTALDGLRLTNAGWWGVNGRRFYGPLLRWYGQAYADASGHPSALLASRLGTCAYQMGLLPEWEASQRLRGLRTARQVEESLRWDGVTQSNSGLGYQVVTAQLAGKTASNAAAAKRGSE